MLNYFFIPLFFMLNYSKLLEIEFNFYSIIFSKCFITRKHLFAAWQWFSSNSPGFINIETLAIFLVFSVVCVKFNMCEWVIFGRLSIECGVKFNMCGRVIWKTINIFLLTSWKSDLTSPDASGNSVITVIRFSIQGKLIAACCAVRSLWTLITIPPIARMIHVYDNGTGSVALTTPYSCIIF